MDAGLNGFLVTMLLSPEYLFRMEMGLGERLPDGRRRLSPHELAYALSFTLYDHPIDSILKAADQGKLSTREDVEREFRALLENTKLRRGQIPAARRGRSFWPVGKLGEVDKPRMLRFFREFFDYEKAKDVFKDDFRHGGVHDPRQIVEDADWFVLRVLADDRDVLEQLLTSDRYFLVYGKTRRANKIGYAAVYNIPQPGWSTTERVTMPKGQRAGMLTHPRLAGSSQRQLRKRSGPPAESGFRNTCFAESCRISRSASRPNCRRLPIRRCERNSTLSEPKSAGAATGK